MLVTCHEDRCVLVDVFTEISCLDTIRFEDLVSWDKAGLSFFLQKNAMRV